MNWKALRLLAIFLIVFGFPLMSGVRLPTDWSPEQIGDFLGQILAYWEEVVTHVIEKLELHF